MDARALLETVAESYRGLKSLAVELLITNESQDDGGSHRSEQRAMAFYVAPDKVRIEQGAGRTVTVTNGIDLHHYFGRPAREYSKGRVESGRALPGEFRPEFPVVSGVTFLFGRIAERAAKAEFLREEGHCQVLSVEYEPPAHPALTASSPLVVWVDSRTHLISRVEGETTHRMPAHDETRTNQLTLAFTRAVANEPVDPETFEFTPPADAIDVSDPRRRGGFISGGGGGGGGHARFDREKGNWCETWSSHSWAGETLIEQAKLRLHGFELAFERRLTLSDDRKELRIVERITAPKGETQRELSIPVA